jgi:hypothetical protein
MPTIFPYAHHSQDHALLPAHLLARVPAAIGPGLAGRSQDLYPHAIDNQDRWSVGDPPLAPELHGRLGSDGDAIDSLTR